MIALEDWLWVSGVTGAVARETFLNSHLMQDQLNNITRA